MNIKKIIVLTISSIVFFSQAPLAFATKTQGDFNLSNGHTDEDDQDHEDGNWKLSQSCEIAYTGTNIAPGPYIHTYSITSMNVATGDFSGTGSYNPDPSYTENISGTVSNSNIVFNVLYTGTNAGYTVDATGTISTTGILSGTATSSTGQTFTFVSTGSCATKTDGDDNHHHDNLKLNWQSQLTKKQCEAQGDPTINIVEKVKNDVDTGFGVPTWWAIDNYTRQIKVWQTGTTGESETPTWCATVKYEGKFNAVAGKSAPGGTGTIGSNVKGEMEGGYRATFIGTLKDSPSWPTHGNVGTFDYNCNISGSCTGLVSWTSQYFNGVSAFDQPWWGWIYKAGSHGTWVNAIGVPAASSGNIL